MSRPSNPVCLRCGIVKTEKNTNRSKKGGFYSFCRICHAAVNKENRWNPPNRIPKLKQMILLAEGRLKDLQEKLLELEGV